MGNFDLLPVFASGLFGSCTRTAKTGKTKAGVALTPAQAKAQAEAARREQRNQEFIAAIDAGDAGTAVKLLAAGAECERQKP